MYTWRNVSHVSKLKKKRKENDKKKKKESQKGKRNEETDNVCERKEKKNFRERSSNFSLKFTEIGS